MLWRCKDCGTDMAVGLVRCPHCNRNHIDKGDSEVAKVRLGDTYTAEKQARLEAEKAERKTKREEAAARKAEREEQEAKSSPGKNSLPQSGKPLSGETVSSPSDQLPARKTAPPSKTAHKGSSTAGSAAGSGAAKK